MITDKNIDDGKPFDWGRVSADYAKFRDIYPKEFYDHILARGFCKDGQKVLNLGTGTGVLRETCITRARSGPAQTYRKTR